MNDKFARRPTVKRQSNGQQALVTLIGGVLSLIATSAFLAFVGWCALRVAGTSDLLTFREVFGLSLAFVAVRSIDLILVRTSKQQE